MSTSNDQPRRDRRMRYDPDDLDQLPAQRSPHADHAVDEPSDPRQSTQRLPPGGDDWSSREPLNPGWRRERAASRALPRRRAGLPSSPQEFQLWMQAGGWRWIAAVAALAIVALIVLLAFRNPSRDDTLLETALEPTSMIGASGAGSDALPPLVAEPSVTPETAFVPTQPPAVGSFFVVVGTSGQGLNLRADHATEAPILALYPDGTRLEQIEEPFPGPDHVWRRVRAPDGKVGWAAAEFLQPAP